VFVLWVEVEDGGDVCRGPGEGGAAAEGDALVVDADDAGGGDAGGFATVADGLLCDGVAVLTADGGADFGGGEEAGMSSEEFATAAGMGPMWPAEVDIHGMRMRVRGSVAGRPGGGAAQEASAFLPATADGVWYAKEAESQEDGEPDGEDADGDMQYFVCVHIVCVCCVLWVFEEDAEMGFMRRFCGDTSSTRGSRGGRIWQKVRRRVPLVVGRGQGWAGAG